MTWQINGQDTLACKPADLRRPDQMVAASPMN